MPRRERRLYITDPTYTCGYDGHCTSQTPYSHVGLQKEGIFDAKITLYSHHKCQMPSTVPLSKETLRIHNKNAAIEFP